MDHIVQGGESGEEDNSETAQGRERAKKPLPERRETDTLNLSYGKDGKMERW
jgi:hypothetical protein